MQHKVRYDIFSVISLIAIAAVYLIFNFPFRVPLITGFIFATLTYPIYGFLNTQIKKWTPKNWKFNFEPISAFIVLICVISLLYPIAIGLIAGIQREIPMISQTVVKAAQDFVKSDTASRIGLKDDVISRQIQEIPNLIQYYFSTLSFENALNVGRQVIGQVLDTVINQIIALIIFLLSWFNGLLYGSRWVDNILGLLPFEYEERIGIKRDIGIGVRNVIYANLISGIINASTVFAVMTIFGFQGVFLSTFLVFLIGFLPMTPSELGYLIPILFLFGVSPVVGIVGAIMAELFILWQNYIFLPTVVLKGTDKGNPLFIITSVLGGIALFGIIGFIVGPVIMIFIYTLSDILLRRITWKETKTAKVSRIS
jgi:predicted PurR-regulated permease PerM